MDDDSGTKKILWDDLNKAPEPSENGRLTEDELQRLQDLLGSTEQDPDDTGAFKPDPDEDTGAFKSTKDQD